MVGALLLLIRHGAASTIATSRAAARLCKSVDTPGGANPGCKYPTDGKATVRVARRDGRHTGP